MQYDNLIKSLPDYERKSKLINEILYATAVELQKLDGQSEQNYNEIFVDTAIKAIQIHAKDLGIVVGSNFTLKQQRELITAHYRASFEQTTEETIKNVASAFSNGEVEINATDSPGVFEIKFVGTVGIPDNMQGLQETIAMIVPAHLMFIYTFILNIHANLFPFTHDYLSAYTHQQIREGEMN